jgi:heat shock protein HtpX
MSLNKLRLSMAGTAAVIIGASTLGLALIMSSLGTLNLTSLIILSAGFNLLQWLLAPYLINFTYRVKPLSPDQNPGLHSSLEELSRRSGIKTPRLMVSSLPIPNAFAYGSPLTGSHVAVTRGLLDALDEEQVNAVVGHELGHIKHRDMQLMMMASFLPSLFYIVARSTMFSRDRERGSTGLVGATSLLVYFVLSLANLSLSRTREYYADMHSASLTPGGARKMRETLARISQATYRTQMLAPRQAGSGGFKALFISDPDRAGRDLDEMHETGFIGDSALVDQMAARPVSGLENFLELFSTHPNMVKRLRALRALETG